MMWVGTEYGCWPVILPTDMDAIAWLDRAPTVRRLWSVPVVSPQEMRVEHAGWTLVPISPEATR
jgi:hypothetical protein